MAKKKTHEQFMKDFYEKNIHAKDIEILGKYKNAKTQIECQCKICGHKWFPTPDSLLNKRGKGTGCPQCDKSKKKNHETFVKEIKEKFPHIKIISLYVNCRTKVECQCTIHNIPFEITPDSLLSSKYACPQCTIEGKSQSRTKTNEQFVNELKERNQKVEPLEEYKGVFEKIKCYCKIHNEIFYCTPDNLLHGHGCSKCQHEHFRGENNPRWNPNLTDEERENGRKTKEYNDFIKYARQYFDYTCQLTGKRGGNIAVHHLDGYDWCVKGRMDINNVIVLTEEIHKKFHGIYGYGKNTREQFEEFVEIYYNKDLRDII